MIRMYVRHTVTDFDTWKRGYDAFDAQRRELGVRGDAIFCGAESITDVTVWHDFDDLSAAQAFLDTPELRTAMETAGVVGEPHIWFVHRDLPA